jgi:glutamate synthase domain-containing protein 3
MTGGEVYVYDPRGRLSLRLNEQLVVAQRPDVRELAELQALVERHLRYTGSTRAAAILDRWDKEAASFWRVAPKDEVAALQGAYEGTTAIG